MLMPASTDGASISGATAPLQAARHTTDSSRSGCGRSSKALLLSHRCSLKVRRDIANMPRLVATPYEGLYAFLHRFDVHTAHDDGDRMADDFSDAFRALTGHSPFPWQIELYNRFTSDRLDNIPTSCNLPTGLGKSPVVATRSQTPPQCQPRKIRRITAITHHDKASMRPRLTLG